MKKLLLGVVASTFAFGVSFAKVEVGKLVSIDSIEIMQKSKEGKKLSEDIKKKVADYQSFVQKAQKDLAALDKELKDKKDILSKDALETRKKAFEDKRKDLAGKIGRREEALRMEIQGKQMQLRDKQLAVAKKMFKDKKWGAMIDKNTPGVLFVADSIDKTKEVLKKIDIDFGKVKGATKKFAASSAKASKVKKS